MDCSKPGICSSENSVFPLSSNTAAVARIIFLQGTPDFLSATHSGSKKMLKVMGEERTHQEVVPLLPVPAKMKLQVGTKINIASLTKTFTFIFKKALLFGRRLGNPALDSDFKSRQQFFGKEGLFFFHFEIRKTIRFSGKMDRRVFSFLQSMKVGKTETARRDTSPLDAPSPSEERRGSNTGIGLESAFLEMVSEYQNIVHKVCRMYRDKREDQEDLFQEILYQLWKAFPAFRQEAKISTWMYRIALNTAITAFRKRRVKVEFNNSIPEIYHPPDSAEISENEERMFEALRRLNSAEKAIISLYLEDYSYKEIAEVVGISENYVGVQINRAKVKLKNLLK